MIRQNLFLVLAGLIIGAVAATHLPLRAQGERKPTENAPVPQLNRDVDPSRPAPALSVQEALLKPYDFRFSRPTTLSDFSQRLSHDLGAPVVLDRAALDRLEIKPEEKVSLDLQGVRLKTGLKLLLDQVGLSYRVVPEDNLLILTDKEGSEEPVEQVLAELRELHRDVHDIQDAVDELRELSGVAGGEGAKVRKPTIIEEVPDTPNEKAGESPSPRSDLKSAPGLKPPVTKPARPRTRL
jgi:hypothetical protein